MLFKKIQFVIFKEKKGTCSKISIPGWVFCLTGLLFMGLIASCIYFWDYYTGFQSMQMQLEQAEKENKSQSIQISTFFHKIQDLEQDLSRIREFDDRLRVMLNLASSAQSETYPAGGPEENSLSGASPFYRQEMLARKMHSFLDQLSVDARLEEVKQQKLLQAMQDQQDLLSSTPSIWPVQGWVSSRFGHRNSPFTGRREFHKGLDVSAPTGTPIYAPAEGLVTFTGKDGAYGIAVTIDHGRGITTRYAHLQKYVVEKNQKISRGQLLGYVGNTGRSTGPHLHYEVRLNNMPVDPSKYILN